uniref:Uncharacterized protein n=1 Tax=Moschus moschiferus TaxID=68415 RepID=A0A8C6DFA6_MOSMO
MRKYLKKTNTLFLSPFCSPFFLSLLSSPPSFFFFSFPSPYKSYHLILGTLVVLTSALKQTPQSLTLQPHHHITMVSTQQPMVPQKPMVLVVGQHSMNPTQQYKPNFPLLMQQPFWPQSIQPQAHQPPAILATPSSSCCQSHLASTIPHAASVLHVSWPASGLLAKNRQDQMGRSGLKDQKINCFQNNTGTQQFVPAITLLSKFRN